MTDKKMMKKSADHKNLEIIVSNGYDKDSFVQGVQNSIHTSPSLNGRCTEEVTSVDENLEQTGKTVVFVHQGTVPIKICFSGFLPINKILLVILRYLGVAENFKKPLMNNILGFITVIRVISLKD